MGTAQTPMIDAHHHLWDRPGWRYLLDEILAELDEDRRADLLSRVSQSKQSLLTTTDIQLFDPMMIADWQRWRIENGTLMADSKETT